MELSHASALCFTVALIRISLWKGVETGDELSTASDWPMTVPPLLYTVAGEEKPAVFMRPQKNLVKSKERDIGEPGL